MNALSVLQLALGDACWAALAGLGFALVFNIPPQNLLAAVAAAAIGHGTRALLMALGMNMPAASLAGATIVGFWAVACARYYGRPAQIFSIPGVIPMIPGKFAYLTMIGLIKLAVQPAVSAADLQQTLHLMMMTTLVLGGLASGIAVPQLLLRSRYLHTGK